MISGLYYFDGNLSSNKKAHGLSSNSSIPVREQIMLWHLKLGHPSFPYLKHLFSSLFKNVDCSLFQCESCYLSKAIVLVILKKPYCASKPSHLIHGNAWGPSKVTTVSGKKWFVTFIDDHTRFRWI